MQPSPTRGYYVLPLFHPSQPNYNCLKRSISNTKNLLNNYFGLLLILMRIVMRVLGLNNLYYWIGICVWMMLVEPIKFASWFIVNVCIHFHH
jgi:hypothetical protein